MATPANGVDGRKQVRQAILRRVRRQRAIVAKRLKDKDDR
jgi:hypothetical protein